ncbi:MAG: DUF4372 domain-containing protein, partial [Lentisphaerae bacterium]|nr:DUF4372 domain-containing protein [Lentisphaerota bacterium]
MKTNTRRRRRQAPRAREGAATRPTRRNLTGFRQTCNLIPGHLVQKLSREFEIDARTFSANSHVLSLLYTHLAHTDSLNETCDALRVHEAEFMRMRGATSPARNTLSN